MQRSNSNKVPGKKFNNFNFLEKRSPFFEGFYFKTAKEDGTTIVVICGFAKSEDQKHAFLQVSTQNTPTFYKEYSLSELKTGSKPFDFKIGTNVFSEKGIKIQEKGCFVDLKFSDFSLWNRSFTNPSIMGILTYIPFVECKHDIIAPHIEVNGSVEIDSKSIAFKETSGYIDKNWGKSFPKNYFWGHISGFQDPSISIQFAKAKPKWLMWKIPVHIGFLRYGGKTYLFKSWKFGKMTMINVGQEKINMENKRFQIELKFEKGIPLNLRAPMNGKLNHQIIERAGIKTYVTIREKKKIINNEILVNETVCNSTLEICTAL